MKLFVVIKREFLSRVRTKGFLVFTFIVPLVAAGFIFFEIQIINASRRTTSSIAVVDLSNQIYPALAQAAAAPPPSAMATLHYRRVPATPASLPAVEQQLRRQILSRRLDGYVVIPADVLTARTAQFHTRNTAAFTVAAALESRLRQAVNRVHMEQDGVPASQVADMTADFNLSELKVTRLGDTTDNGSTAGLAIGMVAALYMVLLIYGIVVMRSVTEEKTSRISEVLLSAVAPESLMLGKILGVVATALFQFAIWGLCLAVFATYGVVIAHGAGLDIAQYIPHASVWLWVSFVIFFLLGFLIYASIYAAIGSMVSTDQEAQQTQVPLTMMLVAVFYLAFLVMNQPNSLLSVLLSLFPFSAPVLMVMRMAVSNPPAWQVLLAMALCAATFLGLARLTAKIYRVGILMTGKRPNLPELLRWLKYA